MFFFTCKDSQSMPVTTALLQLNSDQLFEGGITNIKNGIGEQQCCIMDVATGLLTRKPNLWVKYIPPPY